MNDGDRNDREDILARMLAQYDDALRSDTPLTAVDESTLEADPELAAEFIQAKHCLELLDNLRRRTPLSELQLPPPDRSEDTQTVVDSAPNTPNPHFVGRFRIERQLGQGGLGIVFLAYDPHLDRHVALKVPRPEVLVSPEVRRRFLREAEAVARLNHPNLVAVYEADEDGVICYMASEYCKGPTLAAWLHKRATPVPVREAALIAMQLAEAVQHAHGRGVLHRDIKPSNVLLEPTQGVAANDDPEGLPMRPKLTDFGMAKVAERKGDDTHSGTVIGTLPYMSPEQAEGRTNEVDSRTDVFGLGAILYEMLTGRAPFLGDSQAETLQRLLLRELPSPRRIRRDVPRDLEAICLKSLSKLPADRYQTAQALADDLHGYLTDQPIRARAPGPFNRLRKWSRRHRAVVMTAGVVATCAIVIGAGLLWRERARTLAALQQAQQEREAARESFQQAQEAVDEYLVKVSESTLLDVPGTAPLREDLLKSAVRYYSTFVDKHQDDASLQSELAAAHMRLAQIYAKTGAADWWDELRKSVRILRPLVDEGVDLSASKSLCRGTLLATYRGWEPGQQDRVWERDKHSDTEVVALCQEAIPVWERLIARYPDVVGFQSDLAAWYAILGAKQAATKNLESQSPQSFEKATDIWEHLASDTSGVGDYRWRLASAYLSRGSALQTVGEQKRAAESFQRAVTMATEMIADGDTQDNLQLLFTSSVELANALAQSGQTQAARDTWRLIATMAARLEHSARANGNTRAYEAVIYQRAHSYASMDDDTTALATLSKAIDVDSKSSDLYAWRARVHSRLGEHKEAIADYTSALEVGPWANGFDCRGYEYGCLGDWQKALPDFIEAVKREPDATLFLIDRANCFMRLQRFEEALADLRHGFEIGQDPNDRKNFAGGLDCSARCAALLFRMRRFEEALEVSNAAIERDSKNVDMRISRAKLYCLRERFADAVADLNVAVNVAKGDTEIVSMYTHRACVERRIDQSPASDADFARAIDHCDRSPQDADTLCLRARVNADWGRYSDALEDLVKAGATAPANDSVSRDVSTSRVDVLLAQRQFRLALDESTSALAHFPEDARFHRRRGIVLSELGRYIDAQGEFDWLIKHNPSSGGDLWRRGWVASAQGCNSDALSNFEQAVKHCEYQDEEEIASRRLAWFLATCPETKFRDPTRAESLAKRATELNPCEGIYWYTLGVCQFRNGKYSEARTSCERGLKREGPVLNPSRTQWVCTDQDHYAGFFLAMSLWQLGEKDNALAAFAEANEWMNKHAPDDRHIQRFRDEATAMLGISS